MERVIFTNEFFERELNNNKVMKEVIRRAAQPDSQLIRLQNALDDYDGNVIGDADTRLIKDITNPDELLALGMDDNITNAILALMFETYHEEVKANFEIVTHITEWEIHRCIDYVNKIINLTKFERLTESDDEEKEVTEYFFEDYPMIVAYTEVTHNYKIIPIDITEIIVCEDTLNPTFELMKHQREQETTFAKNREEYIRFLKTRYELFDSVKSLR